MGLQTPPHPLLSSGPPSPPLGNQLITTLPEEKLLLTPNKDPPALFYGFSAVSGRSPLLSGSLPSVLALCFPPV